MKTTTTEFDFEFFCHNTGFITHYVNSSRKSLAEQETTFLFCPSCGLQRAKEDTPKYINILYIESSDVWKDTHQWEYAEFVEAE